MDKPSVNFRIAVFRHRLCVWVVLFSLLWSFMPATSLAQQPTATIGVASGTVLVNGQKQDAGTVLNAGDIIETQAGARVVLELSDGSQLELGENTKIDIATLTQTTAGGRVSRVKLAWGWIRAKLSPDHQKADSSFDIETPNALIGVKFSPPDVKVSYDQDTKVTIGLAYTVDLLAKNIFTDEMVLARMGSTVVVTDTAIKIIAGIARSETIDSEISETALTEAATAGTAPTEATTTGAQTDAAATGTETAAGASDTGAATGSATTGATTAGISTGTMVAIGAGAAAVGGLVAIVGGSDAATAATDDEINIVGLWRVTWNWEYAEVQRGTWDIQSNHTFIIPDYSPTPLGTWSLQRNQFTLEFFDYETTYTGTVNPEGTSMQGSMVSERGTGSWYATRM